MNSKNFARLLFIIAGGAFGLFAPASHAQESNEAVVEHFEPVGDQGTNILNVAGSDVLPHLGWTTGGLIHYAHEPLRIEGINGVGDSVLIASQTKLELWGGIGFYNIVDLQVVLPIVLSDSNSSTLLSQDGGTFAMGDLRIIPRVRAMHRTKFNGFGLAFEVPIHVPSGDTATYSGGNLRVEPRMIADYKLDFGMLLAFNAGYQFRERQVIHNIVSDDAIRLSLGMTTPLGVEGLDGLGTIYGSIPLEESIDTSDISKTTFDSNAAPVEFTLAARYALPWGLQTMLGGGAGITSSVGAPEFRILASLGYQTTDWDEDGDGLVTSEDACPSDPEDVDGFEDDDGCPELDNDGDRIVDTEDDCPLEAEDIDNFEDENGCPDPDNDKDLIADVDDACPDEAEDIDSFEDANGCPDLDNDGDGILDTVDQCRDEAEDIDQFADEDGCPEYDNDGDGFCDPIVQENSINVGNTCQGLDKCPLEKEIVNGVEDDDGCPDEGKPAIVVTDKGIELEEQIFFDSGKDSIKKVSFETLDQVATVLSTNPQVTKIMIEGHTDDTGNDEKNLQLSKDRAASVRAYLMKKGIEGNRLSSEGYGEDRPLVPIKGLRRRKLKEARSQNRRVEILILELNGKTVKHEDKTP